MTVPADQDAPVKAEQVIERALAELAVADERDVTDHIIGTLREAGFSLVHESERLTGEEAGDLAERWWVIYVCPECGSSAPAQQECLNFSLGAHKGKKPLTMPVEVGPALTEDQLAEALVAIIASSGPITRQWSHTAARRILRRLEGEDD